MAAEKRVKPKGYRRTPREIDLETWLGWLARCETGDKTSIDICVSDYRWSEPEYIGMPNGMERALIDKLRTSYASELGRIRKERGFYG